MAPTLTSREFVSLVAGAVQSAFPATERLARRYPEAACLAGRPRQAIRALHKVIAERPCDAVAHRLLGVAYLHAAQLPLAVRHLGLAYDLLTRQSAAPLPACLAFPARLQMVALRLLLASFLSAAGVRKLATEILIEGLEP